MNHALVPRAKCRVSKISATSSFVKFPPHKLIMALWNPNQLLSIAGSARQGELQCSATNTGDGRRCGWQKWTADPDNQAVQALLPSLAATSPEDITATQLLHLAELCLCEKRAHASQKHELASRWQVAIRDHVSAARQRSRPRTPEVQIAAQIAAPQAFYPTPGSSAPSESTRSSPSSSFSMSPSQDGIARIKPDGGLQLRVTAAEQELKRTQERLQTALEEKKTLEGDHTALVDVVKQLSLDQKAVRNEKSELQVALQMRDKEEAERRKRDLATMEEEKRALVSEMEAMKDYLGDMRTEMNQLKTRVVALESDKEALRQQLQEMRVELTTEKTHVSKLLNRLAVDEKKDAGRELVLVKKIGNEHGWITRVQSWVKSMGGTHGVKRPWKGAAEV